MSTVLVPVQSLRHMRAMLNSSRDIVEFALRCVVRNDGLSGVEIEKIADVLSAVNRGFENLENAEFVNQCAELVTLRVYGSPEDIDNLHDCANRDNSVLDAMAEFKAEIAQDAGVWQAYSRLQSSDAWNYFRSYSWGEGYTDAAQALTSYQFGMSDGELTPFLSCDFSEIAGDLDSIEYVTGYNAKSVIAEMESLAERISAAAFEYRKSVADAKGAIEWYHEVHKLLENQIKDK